MQSKVKKDTVKAMQKVMNNSTFYPDSQQYDLVAMEVQGKPNVDKCKEDYDVFVVVHREVRFLIFWSSGSLLVLHLVCMDARKVIQMVFVRFSHSFRTTFILVLSHKHCAQYMLSGGRDIQPFASMGMCCIHHCSVVDLQAEIAARNYRADTGKRINDAIKSVWWGDGMPFDIVGDFQKSLAEILLEGKQIYYQPLKCPPTAYAMLT